MKARTTLENILFLSIQKNASDIYIKTNSFVFYRITDMVIPLSEVATQEILNDKVYFNLPLDVPLQYAEVEKMVEEIMDIKGAVARLREGEIDTTYQLKVRKEGSYHYDAIYKFRVNISLSEQQPAIVFRRLKEITSNYKSLFIPELMVDAIANAPYGVFFVAGPTGSGKSTTLASIVSYMLSIKALSVVTIEDPIEYRYLPGMGFLMQREVRSDTESFATGIRAAMRQKPDIILVGEVRDPETAVAVVQSAKSGHRVLTTLHTSTATGAVSRIINMFPPEQHGWIINELVEVLTGVTVQTLVPSDIQDPNHELYGKLLLCTEVMISTDRDIKRLILDGRPERIRELMMSKKEYGWTMNQALLRRYHRKEITYDSVLRYTNDLDDLTKLDKIFEMKEDKRY